MRLGFVSALVLGLFAGVAQAELPAHPDAKRLVSIGGEITEIIYELGAGDRLIARDTTSNFPAAAEELPDVGYIRALSPEGVLGLSPDLIISAPGAGPAEAVEVLRAAGIPFLEVNGSKTVDGIAEKIIGIGQILDKPAEAQALAETINRGLDEARARAEQVSEKRKVLFILSMQGGRIMAGGQGSSADEIIALAGGENVVTDFQGYKQISDEAIITAAPEVILMMDREGEMSVSNDDILAHPILSQTPAAQNGNLVRMDGMLMLGFGPRTPQAAQDLYSAFYPAAK